MKPVLYTRDMVRVGPLENAKEVGYKLVMNDLHTASFALPVNDADNDACEEVHCIVDVFDGDRSVGKYRIADEPEEDWTDEEALHRYECEHVLAFLFDSRIDGYLEIGGTGVYTRDVIEYLLDLQEPDANGIKRWKLGRCDFSYQFQYAWENEDILNSLFSVPKCFVDLYLWTFDTDSYPWTINLIKRETTPSCEVRYRRNQKKIKRGRNITNLCTRLYCFGSGEGVNQTNIREVNPTGLNFIESANWQKHGVISKALIDRSISDPQTLYSKGQAYLDQMDEPLYSYTIKAVDLHRMTKLDYDQMRDGRMVRVTWPRRGIDFNAYMLEFEKLDVDEAPLDADITISNAPEDISSTIESLSQKAAITAQYAQGATNLFPLQVMDNADPTHPAKLRFFLPKTCSKINTVLLSWNLDQFRAFETGAEAGGGEIGSTLDGGGSTQTSSDGGGQTVTVETRTVAEIITSGSPMVDGTSNFNTGYALASDGSNMAATDAATGNTGSIGEQTTGAPQAAGGAKLSTDAATVGGTIGDNSDVSGYSSPSTNGVTAGGTVGENSGVSGYTKPGTDAQGSHSHTVNDHSHGLNSHTHSFSDDYSLSWGHTHGYTSGSSNTLGVNNYSSKTISISGTTVGASGSTATRSPGTDSDGSHSHTVDNHCHTMNHSHTFSGSSHKHTVDSHCHTMNHGHTFTGSSHSHSMGHWHLLDGHSHTLGNHTHGMIHRHEFSHYHLVNVAVTVPGQTLTINAHSHSVDIPAHSHSFTIPSHTHGIVYGIYEGGMASSVTIKVDGNAVPASAMVDAEGNKLSEIDVIPYLAMSGGKITRGVWHEIQLVPDKLTRIEANLFVQTFITSYTGGNY